MSALPYKYIIGLEIHIELSTESKMFSPAPNNPFFGRPNEYVTPICIGMPGTLPVPNKTAIEKTILLGLALSSAIAKESKFDRKHYFYPDLPKGYQISQYDQPLCVGGELVIEGEPVRFTRIHLEEDAGKLVHLGSGDGTAVDLNRAGVPLVEIVTEPDLTSPAQAKAFLQELRQVARTLKVSDADMEKGMLRCDANVNIVFKHEGQEVKTYISEIKNLNSFRMVERALTYEARRLYDEWQQEPKKREQKTKITVGWDNVAGQTNIQRQKEGAADYRYFPEPDIPPLRIYGTTEDDPAPEGAIFDVSKIKQSLTTLPGERRQHYLDLGISAKDADTIIQRDWCAQVLDRAIEMRVNNDPKKLKIFVSLLINDASSKNSPEQIIEVAEMRLAGEISSDTATKTLAALDGPALSASQLVSKRGWLMQNSQDQLLPLVKEVIAANEQVVADIKRGKLQAMGYLVGQVMQKSGGVANPKQIKEMLTSELET